MNQGLDESLNIESEPPPTSESASLEEKVYSEYNELNGFLQNIDPEISTSQSLERKIRRYFRVGLIAKNGLEKASKDGENHYLLEKGETPTLLHKYAKNINRLGWNFVKDKLRDFEDNIKEIAFTYRGLSEKNYESLSERKPKKLNHFEALDYILKRCKMKEIETRNDVVEALMLAQEMGLDTITINRWDRRRVDNKATGKLISDLFESHYQGRSKTKVYNEIKEEILKTEGRTMSKSTFYRYIKENKETIKLIPLISETDISNVQSNAG